jgi:single-stranded-DNA-specific exonuclease
MTAYDLGFRLGPRINAAGRMDAAKAVVELFDTRDRDEARRLAMHLDTRNEERKTVQQQIIDLAVAELADQSKPSSHVAVIAGEGWHRGVIGIAASKIAERINRPCVVFSIDGELAHGSGRSIEAYHLLNGLTSCADLFEKFGGHSHAAGITIKRERIEQFRHRLNEHAASCLSEEDLEHSVTIDMELRPEEITFQLTRQLQLLEPYGAGNPRPLFSSKNFRCLSDPIVMKDRHLKMRVAGPNNRPVEAVWWHCTEPGQQTPTIEGSIELAYTIETSVWSDEIKIQLNVEDLRANS